MRTIVLPFAAWLGVLQAFVPPAAGGAGFGFETVARLVALASVLGSLTVMIYRLGVWRQEMENTKSNVHVGIERIERRLEAIDRTLAAAAEQRGVFERWQVKTERRLHRLETEDTP
jgi:hypothetical protein